ncbi:unnamed protein product [Lepidochelys kempii]
MAGASEPRLSAAEFERVKLSYLETITQELQEAAGLMGQLDRNLSAWARRAGQPEALAQVWCRFQAQLAAACVARGPPASYCPAQPSPDPQLEGDWSRPPRLGLVNKRWFRPGPASCLDPSRPPRRQAGQ